MTASRRIDIGAAGTVSFQRCAKKSFARADRVGIMLSERRNSCEQVCASEWQNSVFALKK